MADVGVAKDEASEQLTLLAESNGSRELERATRATGRESDCVSE